MAGPAMPYGLPGPLPAGEQLLWQGGPAVLSFTRRVFHVGLVAAYFGGLAAWRFIAQLAAGESIAGAAGSVTTLVLVGAAAIALLLLLGWRFASTTRYSITNRRVLMQLGAALPKTLNMPFSRVLAADVRQHADGTADIALTISGEGRPGYLMLWPHVRPWRLNAAQPMLRSIGDSDRVRQLLADALATSVAPADDRTPGPAAAHCSAAAA